MRLIVELFRYVIIVFLGLMVVGVTIACFYIIDQGLEDTAATPIWFAVAVVLFFYTILSLGLLAILFSMHDRHVELVDQTSRLADSIETLARSEQLGS